MSIRANQTFHFQPFDNRDLTQTDNAPLLFSSQPPGRQGGVTLFYRTRRTLRQRLGVHDLGELDGVLKEPYSGEQDERDQMRHALSRVTKWTYLFPDCKDDDSDGEDFSALLSRTVSLDKAS